MRYLDFPLRLLTSCKVYFFLLPRNDRFILSMPFCEVSLVTKFLIFVLSRCWWLYFLIVSSKNNDLSILKVSTSYLSSTEISFSKSFSDLTSLSLILPWLDLFDFTMAFCPAFLHTSQIPSLCSPPCLSTARTKSFLKSASTVWNSLLDCPINWFPKTHHMVCFCLWPVVWQSFLLFTQLCYFLIVYLFPLNVMFLLIFCLT